MTVLLVAFGTETLVTDAMPFQFQFDVSASGQPKLVVLDDVSGYPYHTTTSWTPCIKRFVRSMTLDLSCPSIDGNGDLHMVYSHPTIEKMYYSTETASGWSNSEILSNANLSSAPSLCSDGADMHILYRDSSLDRLERVTKSEARGQQPQNLEAVKLWVSSTLYCRSHQASLVATTVNNSSVHELQILDIDSDVSTPLTNFSDGSSQLAMCIDTSNTVVLLSSIRVAFWSCTSEMQLRGHGPTFPCNNSARQLRTTSHARSTALPSSSQFNPQRMLCTNATVRVIGPLSYNCCHRLVGRGVSPRMDQGPFDDNNATNGHIANQHPSP